MKILKKTILNLKTKLNFTVLGKYLRKNEKYYITLNNCYIPMLIIYNETGEMVDGNAAACEYIWGGL